jgi:hypothetical protein
MSKMIFGGMERYFEDLQNYEDSLCCVQCDNDEKKTFTYSRTHATGQVFFCHLCKEETCVRNKPNEDNY